VGQGKGKKWRRQKVFQIGVQARKRNAQRKGSNNSGGGTHGDIQGSGKLRHSTYFWKGWGKKEVRKQGTRGKKRGT